jgi:WD repeat-containing protein 61
LIEKKIISALKIFEFSGHSAAIYALENGSTESRIFSGSGDRFLAEWNLETGKSDKFSIKVDATIYSVCNVTEKKILVIGNSLGNINIVDLVLKKEIKNIVAHKSGVFGIAYNFKVNHFYTVGGDGYLNIWDASNFELKIAIKVTDMKIRSLSVGMMGALVAVASGDGSIRLFETNFYNEVENISAHQLGTTMVCFHPDGKRIISGGKDAMMNIWNINETKLQLKNSIPAHNFSIYHGLFSPDNKYFSTCSRDKTIKIWDANTFDFLLRIDRKDFKAHTHSVNAILWSSYQNLLISAGDDRKVMIWKIIPSLAF